MGILLSPMTVIFYYHGGIMGPSHRHQVLPRPGLDGLEPACTMQAETKPPAKHLLQAVKTTPKSAIHSLSFGDEP